MVTIAVAVVLFVPLWCCAVIGATTLLEQWHEDLVVRRCRRLHPTGRFRP